MKSLLKSGFFEWLCQYVVLLCMIWVVFFMNYLNKIFLEKVGVESGGVSFSLKCGC